MKVLVTGGCGFLGSHVCVFYRNQGADVIALDNLTKFELERTGYSSARARDYIQSLLYARGVRVVVGDVRDKTEMEKLADSCDFIVHAAAQPAMTISVEEPELDFSTNLIGTFNILEASRKQRVPVLLCSTIHIYGNEINIELTERETRFERHPAEIDETAQTLRGTVTPLHASKRGGEIYAQAYIDSYGLQAGVFRLTGMYGPNQFGGEDHGWLANFSIRQVMGRPITLFGTGKQVRDVIYVSDVVAAIHAFYERRVPGVYNIGGGFPMTVSLMESIALIEELTGSSADVRLAPMRLGDLHYFACEIGRAASLLGWRPSVTPREGVRKLVEWVQANRSLFDGDHAIPPNGVVPNS